MEQTSCAQESWLPCFSTKRNHLPPAPQRRRYTLSNSPEEIPQLIDEVMSVAAFGLSDAKTANLRLALQEVLLNAIEHGNLGVGYEEKSRALEAGTWGTLIAQRAQSPEHKDRRVSVTSVHTEEEITIVIQDQGNGFAWRVVASNWPRRVWMSLHSMIWVTACGLW